MRLSSVTLRNFRCFRNRTLDLSADITAIYARNGVGKTAIFDAIEYCLTGQIGRFGEDALSPSILVNAIDQSEPKIHVEFDAEDVRSIED